MDFDKISPHIGPLVKILNTAIENHMNVVAAELDLTGTQTHCLHFICMHSDENVTQRTLEDSFSLNHATLSGIISRLETKGFVTLETSREDRRQKFIRPTEKAFECDAKMHGHIEACEEKIVQGLSEEEIDFAKEVFVKMIKNIHFLTEEKKGEE